MERIFKYPIEVTDIQKVNMPEGAEILCVQVQGDGPFLWAKVNPEKENVPRIIEVYGTGHPMRETFNRRYIGTFQLHGGKLVFHAFELISG